MTPHRALNWALAALIALLLSTAYHLDIGDTQERSDTAAAVTDALRDAQTARRFDQAARMVCGGNTAAYALLDNGQVQCSTNGVNQ